MSFNPKRRTWIAIGGGIAVAIAIMVSLAFVLARSPGPGSVQNQNVSSLVFAPDSEPYGRSYADWSALWWEWVASIPANEHPLNDDTGKNCAKNQNDPNVWFLAGTFGGKAERTCTIPEGKAILVSPMNVECNPLQDPEAKTEADLVECVKSDQDLATGLQITVDGVPIENIEQYRVRSPLFNLTFIQGSIFTGVQPATVRAISEGFFVMLKPLPPGEHVLSSGGAIADPESGSIDFATEVTWKLTIVERSNP